MDDFRAGLSRKAEDKKTGMTIRELRLFLVEAESMDFPDDACLFAFSGWNSRLHKLEVRK